MPGTIFITATDRNLFRVQYKSSEGEQLLEGAPRDSKSRALEDAQALRAGVVEDGRYHVARNQDGNFFFHFLGECGEHLAVSPAYSNPEGLGRAIAIIKTCLPIAPLLDLA